MAIVLCPSVEVVTVALVPVLLGALLCAMWPSPTVAAIGGLALRPAATIDGKTATPSATPEPPRDLRVGDSVLRRGELCTIVAIDRSVVPFGVAVQHQGTGAVAHTVRLSLAVQEPAPVAPGGPKPKQPPRPFPDAAPDRYLVQWKWRANSPRHWHVRGMAAMSSAAIPESLCSANTVRVFVPESVAHLTARRRDGCLVGFSIQLEHRKLARHPP